MKKIRDRLAVKVIRLLARAQAWVHWAAFGEPIWVSTDGTTYRYHELGDRHLNNILKLLKRHREDGSQQYKRLSDEQFCRQEARKFDWGYRNGYVPHFGKRR